MRSIGFKKYGLFCSQEVDPLVQRVLEMGPRDASGFREMDEAWRLLKVHVEMQDRDKTLGIGT